MFTFEPPSKPQIKPPRIEEIIPASGVEFEATAIAIDKEKFPIPVIIPDLKLLRISVDKGTGSTQPSETIEIVL